MLVAVFFLSVLVSVLLIFFNSAMGMKLFKEREKLSSFECGFDPKSLARLPFSLHFFLVALIFLIFDVEITLILPMPISFYSTNFVYWDLISMAVVIILVSGSIIEWFEGSLDWSQ